MKHLFETINEAVTDDMPEMSAPLIEIIGEFGLEQPYDNRDNTKGDKQFERDFSDFAKSADTMESVDSYIPIVEAGYYFMDSSDGSEVYTIVTTEKGDTIALCAMWLSKVSEVSVTVYLLDPVSHKVKDYADYSGVFKDSSRNSWLTSKIGGFLNTL